MKRITLLLTVLLVSACGKSTPPEWTKAQSDEVYYDWALRAQSDGGLTSEGTQGGIEANLFGECVLAAVKSRYGYDDYKAKKTELDKVLVDDGTVSSCAEKSHVSF